MSGTLEGGRKAAKKNKELYGDKFYQEIGRKGGRNGHTGGFASNAALARIAGAKGGKASKRGPNGVVPQLIEPKADKIQKMYNDGVPMAKIAKKLSVPIASLRRWANENLDGYGKEWED